MGENTLNEIPEKLSQSQAELLRLFDAADDAALYRAHGEEAWSLAVMLAHLTEARSFFVPQFENLVRNPGAAVGRTLDEEHRVGAISGALKARPSREQLRRQLVNSFEGLSRVLGGLSDSQLQIVCNHARLGQITLGQFAQTLVDHDKAHVEQAKSFLQSA